MSTYYYKTTPSRPHKLDTDSHDKVTAHLFISLHLIERFIYFFILKTACGFPVRAAAQCVALHRRRCLPACHREKQRGAQRRRESLLSAAVSGASLPSFPHVQPSSGTQPGESRPPRAREPEEGAHTWRCPSRFSPLPTYQPTHLPTTLVCSQTPALFNLPKPSPLRASAKVRCWSPAGFSPFYLSVSHISNCVCQRCG